LYGVVLHFLSLIERLEPFAFNNRKMDENVFTAWLLYEAESFTVIEPLDLTYCHESPSSSPDAASTAGLQAPGYLRRRNTWKTDET
jgi:hypothetical protein